VEAFNISREQIIFARERAAQEGLADRLEYIEDDYRNIQGRFDVFVSVGMLEHVGPEQYRHLGAVIDRCLKNGSVVILTTIPPRAGLEKKSGEFAELERKIAAELKVPLIDYQAEILKRRPDDWNGAAAKFRDRVKDVYQVPTLISGDGVHPSNPSQFRDYSEDALSKNGYQLRTALTLNSYADVIRHVLAKKR